MEEEKEAKGVGEPAAQVKPAAQAALAAQAVPAALAVPAAQEEREEEVRSVF